MALRGVLGLPAPFLGAALQGVEPRLQILDEGGVGRLVQALQFVRVGLKVVELHFLGVVLEVLGGPGPHRLESRLAANPGLWHTSGPVSSLALFLPLALPFSSSLVSSRGNFYSRTDERQDAGSSPPKSGARERPSAGNEVPARSAKVGAKSVLRASLSIFNPLGTPGPRTNKGTRADSS